MKSMKILVLSPYDKFTASQAFIAPLLVWQSSLRDQGIEIQIKKRLPQKVDADIVIFDSKLLKIYSNLLPYLDKYNSIYLKIILADTTDSAAWLLGDLHNVFDGIWKNQMYADYKYYEEQHYGGRLHTDSLHRNYNIKDSSILYNDLLNVNDLRKFSVSWNSGLLNYNIDPRIRRFRLVHGFPLKEHRLLAKKRNKFLTARFNTAYSRNTVSEHRMIFSKTALSFCPTNTLKRNEYINELRQSKFCLSPFGWGEICYRDFEAFIYQNVLIKPSMDHLITWPSFYKKNVTFLEAPPLSDCARFFQELRLHQDDYDHIRNQGYENYINCFKQPFFDQFYTRLVSLIDSVYE